MFILMETGTMISYALFLSSIFHYDGGLSLIRFIAQDDKSVFLKTLVYDS